MDMPCISTSLICNFIIATISCSALPQEPWRLWSQGEEVVEEEQEEEDEEER
jgi:hypothetical protein